MVDIEPQFRSTEAALRHLCRFNYEQYAPTPLAWLNGEPGSEGKGMAGFDGAATAGLIGSYLATLPQLWRRLLMARHTPSSVPCECGSMCCSKSKLAPVWLYETAWISATVFLDLNMPRVRENLKVRDQLIMRYFKVKQRSMKELALMAGVHENTMTHYFSQLTILLHKEEKAAHQAINERLESAGLVG